MDANKVCFITCVNDEEMYEESERYIASLDRPQGVAFESIAVRGAASMTAGYNAAMRQTDAKYKVYLHQDVWPIKKNLAAELLRIFQQNQSIGMIGLAGAATIESGIWWREEKRYGKAYHIYAPESVTKLVYGETQSVQTYIKALDGFFLATQYDIAWREDLFDGWHFYDVSQCLEFQREGYQLAIPAQDEPWCIHVCGDKDLDESYWHYHKKFLAEYNA